MNVTVLLYTHKHGTDVTVYTTAQGAAKAAEEIVAEYRDDFDIDKGISDEEAAGDWFQLTDGQENIELVDTQVVEEVDNG